MIATIFISVTHANPSYVTNMNEEVLIYSEELEVDS